MGGDAYSAPLYVEKIKTLATGAIVDKKFYLHRDYLGSIIAITDENGVAIERRHFDAWGNLAKLQQNGVAIVLPTDGTATKLMLLDRGYTGHEHLSEVGLIHMNGRLYDPVLRSFLMPDNFIQQPENTQNYNRYAYVLNNPLMYTDPSGEIGVEILGLLGSMGPTGLAIGGAIMLGSVLAAKWDDWKIKDFFNDNVSNAFKDTTKWFGKQGKSIGKFFSNMFKKSSRFNESKVTSLNYAAVNTTNTISNSFTASSTVASGGFQSNYGGDGSGSLMDHFSKFVYVTDQFNPIALLWDGIEGNITGTDRYNNDLSGFESNMKIASAIPMTKVASMVTNASRSLIINGGRTFAQYKLARGGTETLAHIQTSTGVQRISTEFHHMFITQRVQRAYNLPNWLVNNRVNVFKLNTIQHSLVDPYRCNFLRFGIKQEVGWFGKYNWFTKF